MLSHIIQSKHPNFPEQLILLRHLLRAFNLVESLSKMTREKLATQFRATFVHPNTEHIKEHHIFFSSKRRGSHKIKEEVNEISNITLSKVVWLQGSERK